MTFYPNTDPNADLGDLSGVSAQDDYTPIPAGQYVMQAIKTELKDSKNGGKYVSAQFEVLGHDHVGRKVFENFNIMNTNPQTVEIALKAIKQWVMACGFTGDERLTMALLRELEGKEFVGQVSVEPDRTGQYGDKNRIKRYLPSGNAPVMQGAARPQPTAPQATAAQYAQHTGRAAPAAKPVGGQQPWMAGR